MKHAYINYVQGGCVHAFKRDAFPEAVRKHFISYFKFYFSCSTSAGGNRHKAPPWLCVVWRRWSSLCCLSSNTANHSSTFVNNNKKKGLNSELWARRTDQVLPDSKTKEWTAGVAVVIPACKWNALVRTQAFLKEQKGNHKMWHHFGIFFFPFPGTAWLIGK